MVRRAGTDMRGRPERQVEEDGAHTRTDGQSRAERMGVGAVWEIREMEEGEEMRCGAGSSSYGRRRRTYRRGRGGVAVAVADGQ